MAISISSPPQEIISDLRQACMVRGKRLWFRPDCEIKKEVLKIPFAEAIGEAHVFDFGHLLDQDHADCLGEELLNVSPDEPKNVVVPFNPCILIHRALNLNPEGKNAQVLELPIAKVYYVLESNTHIHVNVFGKLFHKTMRDTWVFYGAIDYDRQIDQVFTFGWGETEEAINERGASVYDLPLSFILLARKGEPVIVDPAPSIFVDSPPHKLKTYQKPNPSVSIVKFNTKRIIQAAQSEPTGATLRPHDRRAHYRRLGNRLITVRSSKIHGGSETPTTKIVQLA